VLPSRIVIWRARASQKEEERAAEAPRSQNADEGKAWRSDDTGIYLPPFALSKLLAIKIHCVRLAS